MGKEPIKLHPAEAQWSNGLNTTPATPLEFCIRIPRKNEIVKDDVSHSGLQGSFSFSKSRIYVALPSCWCLLPLYRVQGEEEERKGDGVSQDCDLGQPWMNNGSFQEDRENGLN